jgi:hypothetical protein
VKLYSHRVSRVRTVMRTRRHPFCKPKGKFTEFKALFFFSHNPVLWHSL